MVVVRTAITSIITSVENVAESPSELAIISSFEGGLSFAVWEEKPLMDNLLIISDKQTGAWYPIG